MNLFKRKDYYPNIKTINDLDKYKQMNPAKMSFADWIWLHPSAYALIFWGIPGCLLFQSIACYTTYYIFWNTSIIWWLGFAFAILGLIALYKQIGQWQINKGLTLFEVFLK